MISGCHTLHSKGGNIIMEAKVYIFELDYSERMKEKNFIKDILKRYNRNTLTGCGVFVNNNPYNLEMLLFAAFEKNTNDFEFYINTNYPNKRMVFNYFLDDIFNSFQTRGYNCSTFIDETDVDLSITDEANQLFLFPSRQAVDKIWKSNSNIKTDKRVFLSHSSQDKKIVDKLFIELQKSQLHVWYDKYEIEPGDSITDKINEGLDKSDIGVICISNNFLKSKNGWTKSELNYFVQRRMRDSHKAFIILNIDVTLEELPPLIQDQRYIDYKDKDSIRTLIDTLRKKLKVINIPD